MVDSEAETEVADDEHAGTAGSGSDMVETERKGGREGGEGEEGEQEGRNKRRMRGSREIHLVRYGRGGEEEKKKQSRSWSYLVQDSTRRAPL